MTIGQTAYKSVTYSAWLPLAPRAGSLAAALFADAHTHTSRAGAEVNAGIVAAELKQILGVAKADGSRE